MAYRRYGRRRTSSRYGSRRMPVRRRRTARRRRTRTSAQRIVIQVIGGPGGHVPVAVTPGKKGHRSVRARF